MEFVYICECYYFPSLGSAGDEHRMMQTTKSTLHTAGPSTLINTESLHCTIMKIF